MSSGEGAAEAMNDVRTIFDEYAAASTRADTQAIAARYADAFVVSGRAGSAAFENDERFLVWLRSVFDRNREPRRSRRPGASRCGSRSRTC